MVCERHGNINFIKLCFWFRGPGLSFVTILFLGLLFSKCHGFVWNDGQLYITLGSLNIIAFK